MLNDWKYWFMMVAVTMTFWLALWFGYQWGSQQKDCYKQVEDVSCTDADVRCV